MDTIKTFAQKFGNDWSMNLVSMMTYSLITTIVPILVAILTVAALILGFLPGNEFTTVANSIGKAMPNNLQGAINMHALLKNLVHITGPLAIISLVGLLWSGSNLFTNVENAFSIVFRVRDRTFLPQRRMAIGMVVILAILLPLSLAASTLVTAGSGFFKSFLPGPLQIILTFVGPLTSLAILWVLFLSIYIVVPNTKVPFRDAWRGALVAAVLFALITVLFPIYFKIFLAGNSKYGATLVTVLVLVVWLWFFALILMIGAQVNAVAMGLRPFQYDVARILAQDYLSGLAQATAPRRRRVPLPRQTHVTAVGKVARTGGRLLARPLRLLALLVWLVARPIVHLRARNRLTG